MREIAEKRGRAPLPPKRCQSQSGREKRGIERDSRGERDRELREGQFPLSILTFLRDLSSI